MNKLSEIKELYINGINHIRQIENIVQNKKDTIVTKCVKVNSVTSKIDAIIDSIEGIEITDLSKINAYSHIINVNNSNQLRHNIKKINMY